jgi:four helix bundle protein
MNPSKSQSFRDLLVWQKAHAYTLAVYNLTRTFPSYELYGLSSQLRRAAASVPANIVEGFRKRTKPDKLRHYNIAQASLDECVYHMILAHDLGYADSGILQDDLEEVARLLAAYMHGLERAP